MNENEFTPKSFERFRAQAIAQNETRQRERKQPISKEDIDWLKILLDAATVEDIIKFA